MIFQRCQEKFTARHNFSELTRGQCLAFNLSIRDTLFSTVLCVGGGGVGNSFCTHINYFQSSLKAWELDSPKDDLMCLCCDPLCADFIISWSHSLRAVLHCPLISLLRWRLTFYSDKSFENHFFSYN